MSVRQSLLAILDQGPCYGYQLRSEFDRRTGSTWPLNVGQIYNTLDRLERDGLVEKGDVDEQGHVYWQITDAGSAEVRSWLASPVERGQATRDELAIKLAVAATLPGVDVTDVIQTQRRASLRQLQELHRAKYAGANPDGPEELAWSLVVDSMIFAAEAEVRWLDHTEQRLALHPQHALALELASERPKRGRPAAASSDPVVAQPPVVERAQPPVIERDAPPVVERAQPPVVERAEGESKRRVSTEVSR